MYLVTLYNRAGDVAEVRKMTTKEYSEFLFSNDERDYHAQYTR